MISNETQAKLNIWRDKAKEGTITLEEMKEAVMLLREGRVSACFASKKSKEKLITEPWPTVDEMLKELMEMKNG